MLRSHGLAGLLRPDPPGPSPSSTSTGHVGKHVVSQNAAGLAFLFSSPSRDRQQPFHPFTFMTTWLATVAALLPPSAESIEIHMGPEMRRWVMTWPQAKRSFNKMSDFDFALDPGCETLPGPVGWRAVAEQVRSTADCLMASEEGLGAEALPHVTPCRNPLQANAEQIDTFRDVDSRYSSWRNDCYLGWLSVFLCDVVCTLHEAVAGNSISHEKWPQKWKKTQLELEGLFFYVEVPWPERPSNASNKNCTSCGAKLRFPGTSWPHLTGPWPNFWRGLQRSLFVLVCVCTLGAGWPMCPSSQHEQGSADRGWRRKQADEPLRSGRRGEG